MWILYRRLKDIEAFSASLKSYIEKLQTSADAAAPFSADSQENSSSQSYDTLTIVDSPFMEDDQLAF
jgi:hypothetical protein